MSVNMNNKKKKSFKDVSNYKLSSVTSLLKYVHHSKRGALVIFDEKSGVIPLGTKHLNSVFEKYRTEFEIAAARDTLALNDQNQEVRMSIAPPMDLSKETVVKTFYQQADVPKLPVHLPNMVDSDLRACFLPLLRQEIADKIGSCVSKIWWGQEIHRPPCWPSHVAPWEKVCRPSTRQKYKFSITFTDVMKLAYYRLLISRGIDPKNHVEVQNEGKEQLKMASRSLTSVEKAWERFFNTIPECDRPGAPSTVQVPAPLVELNDAEQVGVDDGEQEDDDDGLPGVPGPAQYHGGPGPVQADLQLPGLQQDVVAHAVVPDGALSVPAPAQQDVLAHSVPGPVHDDPQLPELQQDAVLDRVAVVPDDVPAPAQIDAEMYDIEDDFAMDSHIFDAPVVRDNFGRIQHPSRAPRQVPPSPSAADIVQQVFGEVSPRQHPDTPPTSSPREPGTSSPPPCTRARANVTRALSLDQDMAPAPAPATNTPAQAQSLPATALSRNNISRVNIF